MEHGDHFLSCIVVIALVVVLSVALCRAPAAAPEAQVDAPPPAAPDKVRSKYWFPPPIGIMDIAV